MRIIRSLKLLLIPSMLMSCAVESPELVPCMCDGSDQTLGILDCMCEPAPKKTQRQVAYIQDEIQDEDVQPTKSQADAYAYLHQSRNKYAPVKLEFVDFRIPKGKTYEDYDNKLGNYRFRIFGCRRFDKEVFLNQGRAMQKDMKFFDVFYETMNDYYPTVVEKSNPYYVYSDKAQAEYVLTAEVNDYFMNVCDEFDWDNVKKKSSRTGTSEMTVTWRLMDLSRSKVYCKGTTVGYGEMNQGEFKGETLLVERAFGDALSKLPDVQCFNPELAKRVSPEELQTQLDELAALEKQRLNFRNQYNREIQGIAMLQNCGSGEVNQAGGNTGKGNAIDVNGGADGSGNAVDVNGNKINGYIDDNGNFVASGSVVDVNGGSRSSFTNGQEKVLKPLMLSDNCQEVTLDDSCTTIKVTKNNITWSDDYWLDIPSDVSTPLPAKQNRDAVENMFANAKNNFCIQSVKPYGNMSPENVYRLRSSVVAVENPSGRKGAGLIISDQMILTSADLLDKAKNRFVIKTINGNQFEASAIRVNPNKNVALLLLDEKTRYAPLPLSLALPEVGNDLYMTLGLLDPNEGENYLDTEGQVIGYRYTEEKGAEIIVNTYVQTQTIGSTLVDKNGNVTGLSHSGVRAAEGGDLFIPIETALKSLGLEICGVEFVTKKPMAIRQIEKPVAEAIDNNVGGQAPETMKTKERK